MYYSFWEKVKFICFADAVGKAIFLERNALWNTADVDYTPYSNIISAVWPTLRHISYTYGILNAHSVDVATYYRQSSSLTLNDPCSHVDSIRCGTTGESWRGEIGLD